MSKKMATPNTQAVYKNKNLPKGFKLFDYTIEEKLSSGGFGIVYLARKPDGKVFAIKEYMPAFVAPRDQNLEFSFTDKNQEKLFVDGLKAFFSEAETVAKINSNKIVTIEDIFEANKTAYFVMPFEQGATLQRILKEDRGFLTESRIKDLFIQITDGIDILHQHGLLHLDIKPGNIMIRPDNTALILDLGTTKTEEELQKLGISARTPGFAAPEQHHLRYGLINQQTDIYGICATLFAVLLGKNPDSATKRFNQIGYNLLYAGQYNQGFLEIINKGMELYSQSRFKNSDELKKSLLLVKPKSKNYIFEALDKTISFQDFDKIKI